MKKYKKWLILPIIAMFFVSALVLSACGKDNKGGGDSKFYSISISGQMPQGVTEISLLDGHNVREGETVEFSIRLQNRYTIGDLKLFGNGVELVSCNSQSTDNGEIYYYRIVNISENVVITFTGSVKSANYNLSAIWSDYNNTNPKSDDKKIEDFFIDMTISSTSGGSDTGATYSFDSISEFKNYLKSDTFYSAVKFGDAFSFTIYSKDNYESFVDDWIVCNGNAVVPYAINSFENIGGTEVGFLKAQYNVYVEGDTSIYFYEEEVVRSAEIKKTVVSVDGINVKDANLPKLVLKDENGIDIETYAGLKTAGTINAYIENINDVWRPLFNDKNLKYRLLNSEYKFEFVAGEYASDKGSFVFKSVGKPYDHGTFAYFTMYIENAKELILNSSNYKKMSITKNNIKKYNMFESDYINVEGEGEYCYVQCKNNMFVDIYDKYKKITITLSNDAGDTKTVTINLPTSSKAQEIITGYSISRYSTENGYKKYFIGYDGTSMFYNNIELIALEN